MRKRLALLAWALVCLLAVTAAADSFWVCISCGQRIPASLGDICPYCGAERHEHVWQAATCTEPEKCLTCGETGAPALGHDWQAADCEHAKTCLRCGKTEGTTLGHDWQAADCEHAKTCLRCGKTEGTALGHDWQAATYQAPLTCRRCGLTEGEPLRHFLTDGSLQPGDMVCWGHYPQKRGGVAAAEIEWIVLDVRENEALLISRYILDAKPYNTTYADAWWETCTLRAWLNDDFLHRAFTSGERKRILISTIDNGKAQGNAESNASGGGNTRDKVFLLSWAEAQAYFSSNDARKAVTTEYAVENGVGSPDSTDPEWWWLRSPGINQRGGSVVLSDGTCATGPTVSNTRVGVRPVIRVNTDPSFTGAVRAGQTLTFGRYPQSAEGTDSTPIEWIVLEVTGNHALLLSKYGLDVQPYNTGGVRVTWETCSLRKWLNGDFMNAAFSNGEQKAILMTTVDNSKSQGYSRWDTNGGYNTLDQVFLLSYAEANKYLDVQSSGVTGAHNNIKSRVAPTAYAIRNGAHEYGWYTEDDTRAGWWWLRSPGINLFSAAVVRYVGSFTYYAVFEDNGCVRPAMWINLDYYIF